VVRGSIVRFAYGNDDALLAMLGLLPWRFRMKIGSRRNRSRSSSSAGWFRHIAPLIVLPVLYLLNLHAKAPSAAGPSIASNAVIITVRKRTIDPRPRTLARFSRCPILIEAHSPSPRRSKPPAEQRDKTNRGRNTQRMPVSSNARMPPINANGTFIKISQAA